VRSIAILQQVAQALDAAHAQNVIHRDVKPHNILLDEAGQAYLSDFGIARSMEGNGQGRTVTMIGTPEYVAPEQVTNGDLTPKTDIYQLGVTLFQMLTGRLPFSGSHYQIMSQHLNEPLPSAESLNPLLPRGCDRVLQQATAKEPNNRYDSAGDFATALATLTEAQTATGLFTLPAALQTRLQAPALLTVAGDKEPTAVSRSRSSLMQRAMVMTTGGVLAGGLLLFSLGAWPGLPTNPNLQTQSLEQPNEIAVDLASEDVGLAETVLAVPQRVTATAGEAATISNPSEVGDAILPVNNSTLSQNESLELVSVIEDVVPATAVSEIINAIPQNDVEVALTALVDESQTTSVDESLDTAIQNTPLETAVNNAPPAPAAQPDNGGDNPPPPAQANDEGNNPPPPGNGNNGGNNGPNGNGGGPGNTANTAALSTAQANDEGNNNPPPPANSQGNNNGDNGGGGNNGGGGQGSGGDGGRGGQGGGRGNRGG
jgi:uncharacterized membrane protein YgcG